MRREIGFVLLLGALALSPSLTFAADEGQPLEGLVIEMVDTPAERAALATYYRAKATAARAEASQHASLARGYSLQKRGALDRMVNHCKNIAANRTAAANQYDWLAELPEAVSKTAN